MNKLFTSSKLSILSQGILLMFSLLILTTIFFPLTSKASIISFPTKIDTLQERINVQVVLNRVITPSPKLTVNGVFGTKTIQAIKTFQSSKGLTTDGKVGPLTRTALEQAETTAVSTTTTDTVTNTDTTTTTTIPTATIFTGCFSGAIYSTTTGEACQNTSGYPAGCNATTQYSYITGLACTYTPSTTTCSNGASNYPTCTIGLGSSNPANTSGELMINGGFELGNLTGWTPSDSNWKVGSDVPYGIAGTQSGNYVAYNTSSSSSGYIYQDVDVSPYTNSIDAGTATVTASGWGVSSEYPNQDQTQIKIMFLDSSRNVISTPVDSGVIDSPTWWQKGITDYSIPKTTRFIRMWANTYEQGYNSGNIDSFSVKVGYTGTPIASTVCTNGGTNYPTCTPPVVATCSTSNKPSTSCTIANGTGTQSVSCSGTTWVTSSCTVSSCNSGYTLSGNSCIPTTTTTTCSGSATQSCTISNGTGTQLRTCNNGTWSSFGLCNVSSCNSGYAVSGGSCTPTATNGNTLTINGQTFSSGKTISVTSPTTLYFTNNLITGKDSGYHFVVTAPGEGASSYNNYLDGAIITGNKTVDSSGSNEDEFYNVGFNINDIIKYNYGDAGSATGVYGIGFKSGNPNMTYTSGGYAYNILKNTYIAVRIKGANGTKVYNNTFYDNMHSSSPALIFISANTDISNPTASTGTKIKNNIFYTKYNIYNISIPDSATLSGFESDYNVFYSESGNPMFNYLGSAKTFAQWQALGYDTHSVVVNPNFIDTVNFVPSARLNYGTNLGTTWQAGLATNATWVTGTSPSTTNQDSTWQVGARVYSSSSTTTTTTTTTDTTKPTITSFSVPSTLSSLTVPVTSFSATDNVAVTKYLLSESISIPSLTDSGWTSSPSSSYTFASQGSKILYAWVRDSVGNISSPSYSSVNITISTTNTTVTTTGTVYYVATNGNDSNNGTTTSAPFATVAHAYAVATPGTTIYVRGGTYYLTSTLSLTGKNGTSGNQIKIFNYPGENPIFDLSGINAASSDHGIYITANYLYLKGLEFKNYTQASSGAYIATIFVDGASNDTFEQIKSHDNQGAGFYFEHDCNNNHLINSDFYNNFDSKTPGYSGGNADGVHMCSTNASHTNYIDGVRSWNNSDDGFDAFCSVGPFIITNSWAFGNGYSQGDGNGFKLAGSNSGSTSLVRQLRNTLSFNNNTRGYNDNDSANTFKIEYSIAYNNKAEGFNMTGSGGAKADILTGNISFGNAFAQADLSGSETQSHNNWNDGITPTSNDFLSLDSSGATGARQADGSLPAINFLKVKTTSPLYQYQVDPTTK